MHLIFKKWAGVIFTICLFVPIKAQLFKGKIVNAQKQGLKNVRILKEGSVPVDTTDAEGNFEFNHGYVQNTVIFGFVGNKRIFAFEILPLPGEYANRELIIEGDGEEFIPTVSISLSRVDDPFSTIIKPRKLQANPSIGGGVEGVLKTFAGVTSNNELSSQYMVRGGNYDENLVYINDIEIYRPQIIQSGQQEGLSVINPDLVDYLSFSAGGFEAQYGDKMSSVLDVHYQQPDSQGIILNTGLLVNSVSAYGRKNNWRFLIGARHYSNGLVGRSLDEQGIYTMNFADLQSMISYKPNARHEFNLLTNTALNRYRLEPTSRSTEFGTIQAAIRLQVDFEGAEIMNYDYGLAALTYSYTHNRLSQFKWVAGITGSNEQETFDIQGAYELKLLEQNNSGNTGRPLRTLGYGYFIDHGRNTFNGSILQFAHLGEIKSSNKRRVLKYGAKFYTMDFADKYSEWLYNDSGGYNIPPFGAATDSIVYDDFVNNRNNLKYNRTEAYLQNRWVLGKNRNLMITAGLRANYMNINKEFFASPRINLQWEPFKNKHVWDTIKSKHWVYKLAIGSYNQTPLYREMRNFNGILNLQLKAQRSWQVVGGLERLFTMWNRQFKWSSEAYFKQLNNLVPYLYDNIRIRYYATNSATGYAWGYDNRINGEFIPGLESWFSFSVMQTKEKIDYVNEKGILTTSPYLRRPSDRRASFSIFFQDELASNPSNRVNLNLTVGTSMPYFLNGQWRYAENPYTLSPYRRLDIGFSKVFISPQKPSVFKNLKSIKTAWLSIEVFNLANFQNTISYQWVKDLNNNIFGVPEYLTSRRLNVRLHVEI